ncbi:MAG: RNA polymerase sigma factor [Dehalococcoidia bacterium]
MLEQVREAAAAQEALDPERERWLVEQARQQPEAFRELYAHYLRRVYAYVAYRADRRQEAKDLVSETFLRAVEKLDQFKDRGDGAFAAWLFRIAQNGLTDFYRRRGHYPEPLPIDDLDGLQDKADSPECSAEQHEQSASLRALVRTLSPRRQEVIALKFFSGLRNKEIAKILGLDERAAAPHLCRGLEDLQRKLVNGAAGCGEGRMRGKACFGETR